MPQPVAVNEENTELHLFNISNKISKQDNMLGENSSSGATRHHEPVDTGSHGEINERRIPPSQSLWPAAERARSTFEDRNVDQKKRKSFSIFGSKKSKSIKKESGRLTESAGDLPSPMIPLPSAVNGNSSTSSNRSSVYQNANGSVMNPMSQHGAQGHTSDVRFTAAIRERDKKKFYKRFQTEEPLLDVASCTWMTISPLTGSISKESLRSSSSSALSIESSTANVTHEPGVHSIHGKLYLTLYTLYFFSSRKHVKAVIPMKEILTLHKKSSLSNNNNAVNGNQASLTVSSGATPSSFFKAIAKYSGVVLVTTSAQVFFTDLSNVDKVYVKLLRAWELSRCLMQAQLHEAEDVAHPQRSEENEEGLVEPNGISLNTDGAKTTNFTLTKGHSKSSSTNSVPPRRNTMCILPSTAIAPTIRSFSTNKEHPSRSLREGVSSTSLLSQVDDLSSDDPSEEIDNKSENLELGNQANQTSHHFETSTFNGNKKSRKDSTKTSDPAHDANSIDSTHSPTIRMFSRDHRMSSRSNDELYSRKDSAVTDQRTMFPDTIDCDCDEKEHGKQVMDAVYPVDVDTLFHWIFDDHSELMDYYYMERGYSEVDKRQTWTWQDSTYHEDKKHFQSRPIFSLNPHYLARRQISFVFPVKIPMSSRTTSISHETYYLRRHEPHRRYVVDVEARTPEVPYGDYFVTDNRFCLLARGPKRTQLYIHTVTTFSRSTIWRHKIERAAVEGMHKLALDLHTCLKKRLTDLKQEAGMASRGLASTNGSLRNSQNSLLRGNNANGNHSPSLRNSSTATDSDDQGTETQTQFSKTSTKEHGDSLDREHQQHLRSSLRSSRDTREHEENSETGPLTQREKDRTQKNIPWSYLKGVALVSDIAHRYVHQWMNYIYSTKTFKQENGKILPLCWSPQFSLVDQWKARFHDVLTVMDDNHKEMKKKASATATSKFVAFLAFVILFSSFLNIYWYARLGRRMSSQWPSLANSSNSSVTSAASFSAPSLDNVVSLQRSVMQLRSEMEILSKDLQFIRSVLLKQPPIPLISEEDKQEANEKNKKKKGK